MGYETIACDIVHMHCKGVAKRTINLYMNYVSNFEIMNWNWTRIDCKTVAAVRFFILTQLKYSTSSTQENVLINSTYHLLTSYTKTLLYCLKFNFAVFSVRMLNTLTNFK